jgi:hypothetical protein
MRMLSESVEFSARPVGPLSELGETRFKPALIRRRKPGRELSVGPVRHWALETGPLTNGPAIRKGSDVRSLQERAASLLKEYYRTRRDWRKLRCTLPGGGSFLVADLCGGSPRAPKRKR